MKSFLFYDLETFGLDPRASRIAQFACLRTDTNLNIIADPITMLCRIAPDYLPSPDSCLVTRLTPQMTLKDGLNEFDFITRINAEFSVPDTVVLGFNNINFDDEFIRNTLYRNLMDPYEREWSNGCSRWDLIDLVRAVHDYRPEGINFLHKTEKGNPSLKLVHLSEDNNIEQEGAHDALVDVYATVNVAKLIKEKQPRLFDFFFHHRTKNEVSAMIKPASSEPLLYTCTAFTSESSFSRPIAPLSFSAKRSNSLIAFDLTKDAKTLLDPETPLYRSGGIIRIATNKCPFLSPLSILTKDRAVQERLKVDMKLLQENLDFIKANKSEIAKRIKDEDSYEFESDSTTDPELRIYMDGFYSDNDRRNMKMVNAFPPERKLRNPWHFDSEKLPKLLFRQVARNWPQVLNENEKILWKNYCASRLLQPFAGNDDYHTYMRRIEEKLSSMGTTAKEQMTLVQLREYGQKLGDELLH